ncbi:phospho-sugar mutase [Corynebacterium sp. P7202]|uniref:Phospho-sugar mutase n=2 Tax=Corynebacterium pygosceleis TaxID=2800406 RepID=A0A9Q4C6S8_9CORY|nr:phospho-sugar mutase [Corynebacterium pygosceleis]MCK7637657.1 phospho-sugar mutase [Corynebacterium pygosceleis]MCX7468014.1 phospho-sugar mutase [Corynebacterium pygosceleis]
MMHPRHLSFGTAGLRAPVGPARTQMNVSQVTRATAGLAAWLADNASTNAPGRTDPDASPGDLPRRFGLSIYGENGPLRVAVGYDARYGSHTFAATAAEVFAGAGFEVTLLPAPTPTPVLPWLVRYRGLDAGVQITASHNPAADNGYKVYGPDGSEIDVTSEKDVEAAIRAVGDPLAVPRVPVRPAGGQLRRYLDQIVAEVNPDENDRLRVNNERAALTVVYTALHGVGGRPLAQALGAAGFPRTYPVVAQQYPDPTFPTVSFPDPEQPDAVALLLRQATDMDADLLIALDPDADRCAVGYRTADGGHRMLRGDELGPLLATRLLPRHDGTGPAPVVATSLVSSGLLPDIAGELGWDCVVTPTGFKNLMRAGDHRPGTLRFAYEEAHGTCPMPGIVSDKDGLATALHACAWAAELKAGGRTLGDELARLHRRFGEYAGAQIQVRTSDPEGLVDQLRTDPPTTLIGIAVTTTDLPAEQGVLITGRDTDGTRVRMIARVSGTEAKTKVYLEVSHCPDPGGTGELLHVLRTEVDGLLHRF